MRGWHPPPLLLCLLLDGLELCLEHLRCNLGALLLRQRLRLLHAGLRSCGPGRLQLRLERSVRIDGAAAGAGGHAGRRKRCTAALTAHIAIARIGTAA
jgi:hypothetical protein